MLASNFEDFINTAYLQSQYPIRKCGHSLYKDKNFFNHHDPSREPDRSAFGRRIARFQKLISEKHSDILFFNVRGQEKSDDLLDLLDILPEKSKILSFVFLGHDTYQKPIVQHPGENVLQIIFHCDNQNTYFAKTKKSKHANGFTNGRKIFCPYSRVYAECLLKCILSWPCCWSPIRKQYFEY